MFQKQHLQQLYQTALLKVRALQNPSVEIKTILQKIFEYPPSSCSGTYGQVSLSTTVSPIQQPSNIFAAPFGQAPNTFGSNPQPVSNIFAPSASNGPFGSPQPSTNIFATQPTQGNIFGGTASFPTGQNVPQQPNIFGNSSANIFAQNSQNLFAQTPAVAQNVFAQNQVVEPKQPQNVFAQNPIVEQNQAQNVFAASQQSLFGAPPSNSPLNAAPPNYSASIFGQPQVGSSAEVSAPVVDAKLYSDLAELSQSDKNWFASDALDIMGIPDKPPSFNLCFGWDTFTGDFYVIFCMFFSILCHFY